MVMSVSSEIRFDDIQPMRQYHGKGADSRFRSVFTPLRAAGLDRLMPSERAMGHNGYNMNAIAAASLYMLDGEDFPRGSQLDLYLIPQPPYNKGAFVSINCQRHPQIY
jgi:hypothetical protein